MSTRDYEAMFLLDNAAATADFEATAAQVDNILAKHGATIVQNEKWDERRLAYEIKGHRRATYYLVYFNAPAESLVEIDSDVALNEVILRHLTVALEEPIDDHIKHRADDCEKMAEESRRSSLSGWGDRKGGRDRDRGERDRPRRPEGDRPEGDRPEGDRPAEAATPEAAGPEAAGPEAAAPEGGAAASGSTAETPAGDTKVAVTSAETGETDAGKTS